MVWQSIAAGASLGLANKLLNKPDKPDYSHLQKGIQWRVADAKAAGISPLAALGANIGAPTVLNSEQSTGASVVDGAVRGALNGIEKKRQQELFLLQGAESAARTRLLNAQTDAVTLGAAASADALNKNRSMSSSDPQVEPRRLTPPPTNRSDKDARTQKLGEIGGEVLNISEVPKMIQQGAMNKRDSYRAKYVYDELTGRVYRNPNQRTKRITRRGFRR